MNRSIVALVLGSIVLVACGASDGGADSNAASVSGSPWRVLVDAHRDGGPIEPGIRTATDADGFDELWALLGRAADRPSVDFDDEIVIAYAVSYPSGCEFPFIDLAIDESEAVISGSYAGNEPAVCAADENQYLVMVGIDRDALEHPRYELTTSLSAQTATLEL